MASLSLVVAAMMLCIMAPPCLKCCPYFILTTLLQTFIHRQRQLRKTGGDRITWFGTFFQHFPPENFLAACLSGSFRSILFGLET